MEAEQIVYHFECNLLKCILNEDCFVFCVKLSFFFLVTEFYIAVSPFKSPSILFILACFDKLAYLNAFIPLLRHMHDDVFKSLRQSDTYMHQQ